MGVYRVAIGATALLHGEPVGREMGMRTWVSVAGNNDRAVAHGEFIANTDPTNALSTLRILAVRSDQAMSISVASGPSRLYSLMLRRKSQGLGQMSPARRTYLAPGAYSYCEIPQTVFHRDSTGLLSDCLDDSVLQSSIGGRTYKRLSARGRILTYLLTTFRGSCSSMLVCQPTLTSVKF